jgi:hypothetical protein
MNTELIMYVLVRKDLDETYRIVQGSHAVVEYSLHGDREQYDRWHNSTIVFLGVQNEGALKLWQLKLGDRNRCFTAWHEPDLNGQLTALACIDTGGIFRKLNTA